MIKKIKKWSGIVCAAIIAGIVVVQMTYALIWAFNNGNNVQGFYDSAIYINGASSLCSDGWRLMGYSYFIRFFASVFRILGENNITMLFCTQIIYSSLCLGYALGSISKCLLDKKMSVRKRIVPVMYVITLPIVWQMQFSVLPDAFCAATCVLMFAKVLELIKQKCEFCWCNLLVVFGGWLLLGVLNRHYMYGMTLFLFVITIFALLKQICQKNQNVKSWLMVVALFIMLTCVPLITTKVNSTVPQTGECASYSLVADSWKRFVYPNLSNNYAMYSSTVQDVISEKEMKENSEQYEHYINRVGIIIETNSEDATAVFREIAEIGFWQNTKMICKSSIKEMASYCFIPFAMYKYMYNNVNSLYGYNYSRMYEKCPKITADYMHIGMNGFGVVCLLGVLQYIRQYIEEKKNRKSKRQEVVWLILVVLCITFPMMLFSVAKFDYRIGIFSACIWGMVALLECRKES